MAMDVNSSRTRQLESDSNIATLGSLSSLSGLQAGRSDVVLVSARYLWANRGFITKVTATGLVITVLIAILIPNSYKSTVRLMPPDEQSRSGLAMIAAMAAGTNGLGGLAGDVLGIKSTGALFIGAMRSRTVEDAIIRRFDLQKVYRARYLQDARRKLEENTSISEDRKSGIITVEVTDKDPRRAAAIADTYLQELDNVVTSLSTSRARKERLFLEERLKSIKEDLDSAAKQLSEFSSKNTAIDIKEQGRAMVEAAATLQGQVIAAESALKGLETIYTENNVRVRASRAHIAELKQQLAKLGGSQQASSSQPGSTDIPSIRQLPILGVKYADLYRQVKIQETVYEVLTKQYELAKVEEAKEVPSVRILDNAEIPEKKSGPARLVLVVLGALFSLSVACTWLLVVKQWSQLEPSDDRKQFAIEVFSTSRNYRDGLLQRLRSIRQKDNNGAHS